MKLTIVILFLLIFSLSLSAQSTVKLKGQLVCSLCWFEAKDRKKTPYGNAADIKCAVDCSENGLPQALAVEDEKGFTLYILEKGLYQTKGKDFLDIVPKMVEIEGELRTEKDKHFLKVNELRLLTEKLVKPTPVSDDAVLALKDIFGAKADLSQLAGRIVVLNFWATWCEPCKTEIPYLTAIQNEYAVRGVQVLGAAADEAGEYEKVLSFARETKMNFPIWLGASTADMERFGVGSVLPATAIIDGKGKVVWRTIGIIKPAKLRAVLEKMISEQLKTRSKVAGIDKTN